MVCASKVFVQDLDPPSSCHVEARSYHFAAQGQRSDADKAGVSSDEREKGGRAESEANLCVCLSQLVQQQHRRRGMQGAGGGTANQHRADNAGVSDHVGASARGRSSANICVCLSQLGRQQHRRRGMQGACGGTADQHHADVAGVSDDVGASETGEKVEPTFVSVCHSLWYNNIDDEGCKALAAALQTNTTLAKLM
jgi:hypothetical protein